MSKPSISHHLIQHVAQSTALSEAAAYQVLRAAFEYIAAASEPVKIENFGVFSRKTYPERTIYDPLQQCHRTVPERSLLKLRLSRKIKPDTP